MKYLNKYILISLIITLYSISVKGVENKILFKVNNEITLEIEEGKYHLFDKETKKRLN